MIRWMGADWDRDKCIVCFKCGDKVRFARVTRDLASVKRFVKSFGDTLVCVGIEDGDRHWQRLWETAGATVFVFDPKKAKSFSASLTGGGVDDKSAARALLAQVQSESHRAHANAGLSEDLRGLMGLSRLRERLSQDVQRHRNRLHEGLRQWHPCAEPVLRKRLKGKLVLELLQAAPTARAFRELDNDERDKLFKGMRHTTRKLLLEAMPSQEYPLGELEEMAAQALIVTQVRQMQAALIELDRIHSMLEQACSRLEHSARLRAIPGVGVYLSAGLLIATGGNSKHRDALATQTGCAPVTIRSGTKGDVAPHVKLRRNASSSLRHIGYLVGTLLVRNQRWAKAQYQHYRLHNSTPSAAYRKITRSFGRILHALMRDNSDFDEETYIQALKNKGVSWAMAL